MPMKLMSRLRSKRPPLDPGWAVFIGTKHALFNQLLKGVLVAVVVSIPTGPIGDVACTLTIPDVHEGGRFLLGWKTGKLTRTTSSPVCE